MVKCGKKFHIIICPFKDSLCKNGFLLIYLRESEMSVWTLMYYLGLCLQSYWSHSKIYYTFILRDKVK